MLGVQVFGARSKVGARLVDAHLLGGRAGLMESAVRVGDVGAGGPRPEYCS